MSFSALFFAGCSGSSNNSQDDRRVVSLQVSGPDKIAASFSTQLQVTAIFNDKTSEDVTLAAAWGESGDSGSIRVLAAGIVEALSPGVGTVSVSYEDAQGLIRANYEITVSDAKVTKLFIAPINEPLGPAYQIPNGQAIAVVGLANF